MSQDTATNLYPALLAAMKACGKVLKNATNPHLKSKYADLTSVLDTIEQPLWDNGLLIVQRFTHDQGGAILVTELIHAASGERIASEVPVVSKDPTDPQKIGAAITYYRRYSLLALLGLAPEDDDGHSAAQPRTQQATPARQSRTSPQPPSGPRPAVATTAAGHQPTMTTMTADAFTKVLDTAWEMAEDNKPLDDIKNYLNANRHGMTKPMRAEVVTALARIEAQHYTAASVAG